MGRILATTSGKGGVGKSTTAVGLAMAFCKMGQNVLLVDMDRGLGCIDLMLGMDESAIMNLDDVLNGTPVEDAAYTCKEENLKLITAPKNAVEHNAFKQFAKDAARLFDIVIFDFPAGLEFELYTLLPATTLFLTVAIPEPVSGAEYTVEGNRFAFSLGHDERITLPCIPIGATVKVEEQDYEGFLVSSEVEDGAHQQINGALREIQFSNTPQTIHFYNQTGFRLPNTGGMGTALYAAAGTGLCLSMGIALLYERLRRGRQAAAPTHKTNQHGKDRNHESNS